MDPLTPITPPAHPHPSRRVPAVERLPRVSREGDHPRRDPDDRPPRGDGKPPGNEGEEPGEGHIDVRA